MQRPASAEASGPDAEGPVNVGIVILVVLGVVILTQLLVQRAERRRQHAELVQLVQRLLDDGR